MKMLYVNEKDIPPTCLVFAWMRKYGHKSFTQFPTYTDDRGDKFCKELENDSDFIGWCRNPWSGEVLLTSDEIQEFRDYLTSLVLR